MGHENCYIYYKCCFVLMINKHQIRSVEVCRFISYDQAITLKIKKFTLEQATKAPGGIYSSTL
jgi:hypothetical protein